MRHLLPLLLLPAGLLTACGDKGDDTADPADDTDTDTDGGEDTDTDGDSDQSMVDSDGDGVTEDQDCDDGDASVYPGADETCDGIDNDCDGEIDEGAVDATAFQADADGDGFGDPDVEVLACEAGDGVVADATDCDDTDATVHPDATELGCDGLDNDCDGTTDLNRVPTEHATLQAAVDALPDGSEICVEPGTYTEALDLSGRTLSFTGQGGTAATVLDMGSAAPMISIVGESETFAAGDITLSGFTITGDEVVAASADVLGGFAHVDGGTLRLHDIVAQDLSGAATDGHSLEGLLVYGVDAAVSLEDVTVDGMALSLRGSSGDGDGIAGAVARTVRGELAVDTLVVTGLTAGSAPTRHDCALRGVVLGADDNGSMSTSTSSLEGSALDIADVEIRDSSISLDCTGWTFAGSLVHLVDTTGDLTGLTVVDNVWSVQSSERAIAPGVIYTWNAREGSAFSAFDVSRNSISADAPDGRVGAVVDVEGDELRHIDVWSNTLAFTGGDGGASPLVTLAGGDLSHVDVRANTIDVTDWAGTLVEVWVEERDAAASNLVIAGNDVQADKLFGAALEVAVALGILEARNVDIVGNTFDAAVPYSNYGLVRGGGEVEGDLVDLHGVQIIGNTYAGDDALPAVATWWEESFSLSYSNLYGNTDDTTGWGDVTGQDGNISADPLYTDVTDPDPTAWDLSLQAGAPGIDAGDPTETDDDGSTADMGAYGGPGGSGW